MYAQEKVSEDTARCGNCSKRGSFQPVMEIKSLGVTIMRHVADTVRHIAVISGNDNKHKNSFIIINANQNNLNSEDILSNFDINKVSCPRCRYRAEEIHKMLQNKVDIDKTVIRGICDHCKDKLSHETCPICEDIVNKFLAASAKSGFLQKSPHFHRHIISEPIPTLEKKQYGKTKPISATMRVIQPESDTEYLYIPIKHQVERKPIEFKEKDTPIFSKFPSDESVITSSSTSSFKADKKMKEGFKYVFPKDVKKVEDTAKAALKTSSELIMATREKLRKEYFKDVKKVEDTAKAALKTSSELIMATREKLRKESEKKMAKEKDDRKEKITKEKEDGDDKSNQNKIGGEKKPEIKKNDEEEVAKKKHKVRDLKDKVSKDKQYKKGEQKEQFLLQKTPLRVGLKSSGDDKSTKDEKNTDVKTKKGIDDSGKTQSKEKRSSKTKIKMDKDHKGDKKLLPSSDDDIKTKKAIDDSRISQSRGKGSSKTKIKMEKDHKGDKKLLPPSAPTPKLQPPSAPQPKLQPLSAPPPESQPSKSFSPPEKEDKGAKAKITGDKEKSKTVPTDKDKKNKTATADDKDTDKDGKEKSDKDRQKKSGKDEKGTAEVKIRKIETEPPALSINVVPQRSHKLITKAVSKQTVLAQAQVQMKDMQEAILQKARADAVSSISTLSGLRDEYFLFRVKVNQLINHSSEEKITPHRHKKRKEFKKLNFNKENIQLSLQNLIFETIKEKKKKAKNMRKHIAKYNIPPVKQKFSVGSMSTDSDLESLIKSMTNLRRGKFVRHKIFHTDIVRNIPEKPRRKLQPDPILYHAKQTGESESLQIFDLEKEENQEQEPKNASPKGIICYALSKRSYIDKGWTLLPTEKIVRKLNIYKVRPTNPEFDWFNHNKQKGKLQYDTGEKLAEFDEDGRGRLYYKNGRLALDYYDCEEAHAQQRFVIYSSGESNERCRTRVRPVTVLAMFDYLGSGVVFDQGGKIRVKYNQTEGVVLDRGIGPMTRWKWHTLNDPPILKQVMIDTHMDTPDPEILKLGSGEPVTRLNDEQVVQIELQNFIKEKTNKLNQNFQPFQIKMKALKINEQFSLRILDQAHIYLHFNDGPSHIKMNLGMILDNREIIDTETSDYTEVANSLELPLPKTDSILDLQTKIRQARQCEYTRREHKERVRPTVPVCSADKLVSAVSKPLRPPLPSTCPLSCKPANFKRKPSDFNVYYATRFI